MSACHIRTAHCEQCGSTDSEDIDCRSYSGCCNEIVVSSDRECRDHHGIDKRWQSALDDAVHAAGFATREQYIDKRGIADFRTLADSIPYGSEAR